MTHLISTPGGHSHNAARIYDFLSAKGYRTYRLNSPSGEYFTALNINPDDLHNLPVESCQVIESDTPYILASKQLKEMPSGIHIGETTTIGAGHFGVMAGPCSIESAHQIEQAALAVKAAGATVLRGGAFKPRSSPYAFQGMGEEGLKILKAAGQKVGLPVVSEVMDSDDVELVAQYADILQIGARNCQNFSLLKRVGKIKKPVLLKRGGSCTIKEFLQASEYILSGGNMQVILCLRGIKTFENATRNTLDISAIAVLKQQTHLPVIVDPSHAAGQWQLVEPLALAAVAAGADGLMIEVHPSPDRALCDGSQSLKPKRFVQLMEKVRQIQGLPG